MSESKNKKYPKWYRNVKYEYHEWKDWFDRDASGYWCGDQSLLIGLNTTSFSTRTEREMRERIDDYIDNRLHYRSMVEMLHKAKKEYYKDKPVDD